MNTDLVKLLDVIAGLKVIVIGEAILDCHLEGYSAGLCPEAPAPVVTVTARKHAPSGAANTAVNVQALGAKVKFLSVIGDDWEGILLQQALEEHGVATKNVLTHPGRRTLSQQRVMAESQLVVRVDQGSTDPINSETEQTLIDELERCFPECDAVIVSDCGYGILTSRIIQALAKLQHECDRVLVVDSKNLTAYRDVGVTDARADQISTHIAPSPHSPTEKYVPDPQWLAARVASYRATGRRIVFTNGCFDILHAGHVAYLKRARELGDILIIGVNSDTSVSRLKGSSRPINPLEDRIQVLAALSCVDCLVPFDDNTPSNLIRIIRPDIYVKGGDYTKQTLPEASLVEQLGGDVQILPLVENRSTTSIVERIRSRE